MISSLIYYCVIIDSVRLIFKSRDQNDVSAIITVISLEKFFKFKKFLLWLMRRLSIIILNLVRQFWVDDSLRKRVIWSWKFTLIEISLIKNFYYFHQNYNLLSIIVHIVTLIFIRQLRGVTNGNPTCSQSHFVEHIVSSASLRTIIYKLLHYLTVK